MKYRAILMLCLMPFSLVSLAVEFKKPITRLQAPVLVGDVLNGVDDRLSAAPWPQTLRGWVSKQQIMQWLTQHATMAQELIWHGPSRGWVEWCFPLDPLQLKNKLKRVATSYFTQHDTASFTLHAINKLPCVVAPPTDVEITDLSIVGPNELAVEVELSFEQHAHQQVSFQQGFSARQNVARLTSSVSKHTPFHKLALEWVTVDWNGITKFITAPLNNMLTKKHLSSGTVLQPVYFTPQLAVHSGQTTTVKLINGAVQIETRGVAMSGGQIGDEIRIKVEGAKGISMAKVIAKGVVHVSV